MINYFKDRHQGERCVIICNGPSLNDTNFSLIRNETCIGLNKIFLGFNKFMFYPRYYVAVNKKVLIQSEKNIKSMTCVKFLSARCPEIFSSNALTHIIETDNPYNRFCKNIALGLEEGYTVTYAALQIAFYMGFQKVIIVGMDHRFKFEGKPNESSILTESDPNHFDERYFGGGQEWDNPDLANSESFYKEARRVFEEDGRKIIDATLNGACYIFEKDSLENSLKN